MDGRLLETILREGERPDSEKMLKSKRAPRPDASAARWNFGTCTHTTRSLRVRYSAHRRELQLLQSRVAERMSNVSQHLMSGKSALF